MYILHYYVSRNILQNIFDIKNMDRTTDDSISPSKQDRLYNKNMSNFKLSLCEGFPFRGFPENEIPTIHNNVKNVKMYYLYRDIEFIFLDSGISIFVNPNSAIYIYIYIYIYMLIDRLIRRIIS